MYKLLHRSLTRAVTWVTKECSCRPHSPLSHSARAHVTSKPTRNWRRSVGDGTVQLLLEQGSGKSGEHNPHVLGCGAATAPPRISGETYGVSCSGCARGLQVGGIDAVIAVLDGRLEDVLEMVVATRSLGDQLNVAAITNEMVHGMDIRARILLGRSLDDPRLIPGAFQGRVALCLVELTGGGPKKPRTAWTNSW